MPFISSKVSVTMEESQRNDLVKMLGKAISIIPGKSEEWLMIEFADRCDLSFQGKRNEPAAIIEVKVFGKIPKECLDRLTKEICSIYRMVLKIDPKRLYVKYEEADKWGWNGENF